MCKDIIEHGDDIIKKQVEANNILNEALKKMLREIEKKKKNKSKD